MEKLGGVLLSVVMGGVLCFALLKIYSHEDEVFADHHFGPAVSAAPAAKAATLPCRK